MPKLTDDDLHQLACGYINVPLAKAAAHEIREARATLPVVLAQLERFAVVIGNTKQFEELHLVCGLCLGTDRGRAQGDVAHTNDCLLSLFSEASASTGPAGFHALPAKPD